MLGAKFYRPRSKSHGRRDSNQVSSEGKEFLPSSHVHEMFPQPHYNTFQSWKGQRPTKLILLPVILVCMILIWTGHQISDGFAAISGTSASGVRVKGLPAAMQGVRTVDAPGEHTATVIFLHGLSDQGLAFKVFAETVQQTMPYVKFILPTARTAESTVNGDSFMPMWFDMVSYEAVPDPSQDDEAGMMNSVAAVKLLIEEEIKKHHIPASRIVLGGVSQGSVISLLTGMSIERDLAGIVALSGWVPLKDRLNKLVSTKAKNMAVFWGHGKEDELIPYSFGKSSARHMRSHPKLNLPLLKENEYAKPGMTFHGYDNLTHACSVEEIEDVTNWLTKALPE